MITIEEDAPGAKQSGSAVWLADETYMRQYRTRTFAACRGCPARGQAADAQMERHLELRRRGAPHRVQLLLIAESPPWSADGAPVRHFYHPEAPPPDNLFRATAAAVLDEDRTRWPANEKAAALARLADQGFLLLDGAKCPVNHLASAERRAALSACAEHVLRQELARVPWASGAVICLVVRSTVPPAVNPVLASLGLRRYLVEPEAGGGALPFPGRWSDHRQRFITGLRAIAQRSSRP
jgi:hypothetical protein